MNANGNSIDFSKLKKSDGVALIDHSNFRNLQDEANLLDGGDISKTLVRLQESLKKPRHWAQRRQIEQDIELIKIYLENSNDSK